MLKGFKEFVSRGNVVDLAVAVVIGTAFSQVVDSFVKGILLPIISALVGQPSFDKLTFTINNSVFLYGTFLTQAVNFLLVSAGIYFLVVVPIKKLAEMQVRRRAAGQREDEASVASDEAVLLRDPRSARLSAAQDLTLISRGAGDVRAGTSRRYARGHPRRRPILRRAPPWLLSAAPEPGRRRHQESAPNSPRCHRESAPNSPHRHRERAGSYPPVCLMLGWKQRGNDRFPIGDTEDSDVERQQQQQHQRKRQRKRRRQDGRSGQRACRAGQGTGQRTG